MRHAKPVAHWELSQIGVWRKGFIKRDEVPKFGISEKFWSLKEFQKKCGFKKEPKKFWSNEARRMYRKNFENSAVENKFWNSFRKSLEPLVAPYKTGWALKVAKMNKPEAFNQDIFKELWSPKLGYQVDTWQAFSSSSSWGSHLGFHTLGTLPWAPSIQKFGVIIKQLDKKKHFSQAIASLYCFF